MSQNSIHTIQQVADLVRKVTHPENIARVIIGADVMTVSHDSFDLATVSSGSYSENGDTVVIRKASKSHTLEQTLSLLAERAVEFLENFNEMA